MRGAVPRSRMTDARRREFLALAAASTAALSGCSFVDEQSLVDPDAGSDDTVTVTTVQELQEAFATLDPGDTIRISGENAPYRTTRWLDVDVDGVTVIGPGVANLIQPADGAHVGGFRIGHESRCRGISITGVGYDGNPEGQRPGAKQLHGIVVEDAADVTIERNRIQRTHPEEHGSGGSGISVHRGSSGVWINNNRISEFGDRGVQLGGRRLVVGGNVITEGLDRPIAADLWDDAKNPAAKSVSIYGNLLGNTVEGSLVGIARNTTTGSNEEYVSVFGNVGFGVHKSFCHVRGPRPIRNISVQNNVSVHEAAGLQTEKTSKFSGVTVDMDSGRNIAVEGNELHGYSGHGVHVFSDATDVTIQRNRITDPGLSGVRLADSTHGLVEGNFVSNPAEAGIRLTGSRNVVVHGNYVRGAGTAGIVTGGTRGLAGHDVTDNYVIGNSGKRNRSVAAIVVDDRGLRVAGNAIAQNGTPAIAERDGAANNVYADNWADGDDPWRVASPTSRARNNEPPTGSFRDVTVDPDRSVARLEFDEPHSRAPRLTFGNRGGGIRDVTYERDDDGNVVGAAVTVEDPDATLDVFVDAR